MVIPVQSVAHLRKSTDIVVYNNNIPYFLPPPRRGDHVKSDNTLREISGTYWLTWVSLAIVSRLTRIIRSIDPTVANFQVNDPDLCEIRGDENYNLPLSLLLNLLSYTIEKCRFVSHSDIAFSWKFVLFSIHITLLWEDIYIHHVVYVCSVCISLVLEGYITNLLTLKLRGLHSDSNRCLFALQSDVLSITPSDPEALSDIFGYILPFSLISNLN